MGNLRQKVSCAVKYERVKKEDDEKVGDKEGEKEGKEKERERGEGRGEGRLLWILQKRFSVFSFLINVRNRI